MDWEPVQIEVKTVDWKGNALVLKDVPAERNTKTRRLKVDPQGVARAELRDIAESVGLEERDILLFLLLYAKPGVFQRGYLAQKYKLNKMLWYQWKELEKLGLGEAIPHDEFEADLRGPVPKSLWDDLTRLRKKELIRTTGGRRAKTTVVVELTDKGEKVASELWKRIPDPYLMVTSRVKDWLFPLDTESIRKLVHKDYPNMRRKYRHVDQE